MVGPNFPPEPLLRCASQNAIPQMRGCGARCPPLSVLREHAAHSQLSPGRPVWLGLFPFGLCYFLAMSTTLLYRRPNTGRTVQEWSADEVTDDNDDNTCQSFEFTFCTRVHLVNPKTGKVLGGEED